MSGYISYGKEWEKTMMKFTKKELVALVKENMMKRQKLRKLILKIADVKQQNQ